jgi:hypothetical protein
VVALSVVALALGVVVAVPASRAAADTYCSPVKVLGVRGSGEIYDNSNLGMGPELYGLYQQVVQNLPDYKVTGTGINYPAYGNFLADLVYRVPLDTIYGKLNASINAGVGLLQQQVSIETAVCPNERLVLIGYSQGAGVVGSYLKSVGAGSSAYQKIVASVLWADPSFNETSRTSIPHISSQYPSWSGILGQRSEYQLAWGNSIASYCLQYDPVCDFDWGLNTLDYPVHGEYPSSLYFGDSVARIDNLVNSRVAVPPEPVPPPPAPSPGPEPVPPPLPTPPPPPKDSLFVYNHATGAAYTELSPSNGQWQGILDPGFSAGWSAYPGAYTADGHSDLFLYNQANGGTAYTERPNGDGGWSGTPTGGFSAGWSVYPGSYNGDGRTELFLYNQASGGTAYIETANSAGGWSGTPTSGFSAGWSVYPGDYNGDGRTDLFLYNQANGRAYTELSNGAGGWSGTADPGFSPGWSVYPGNFTSNGRAGLFLYNSSTGAAYTELSNGAGGWSGIADPGFSAGWSVYPGDYNGDGRTDLFLYNQANGGTAYTELSNGAGGWSGIADPGFSAGWSVYPGNFTSDNDADLFLYNSATGAAYTETSNGAGGWAGTANPGFSSGWDIYVGAVG